MLTTLGVANPAEAATIRASYESGYLDVLINDYGTTGMGTFRLDDGANNRVALCIEAHEPHSLADGAYDLVSNTVGSAHLDALLWIIERIENLDDDTAVAAAALAWYYADAQRSFGLPVWSDWANGFAPITPHSPDSWSALPQFSASHPVGLKSGSTNLDAAERRLVELDAQVKEVSGKWTLTADPESRRFRLTRAEGPLANRPLEIEISGIEPVITLSGTTGSDGWTTLNLPPLPNGAIVTARTESPGTHQEWDGGGRVQRMSTATTNPLTASFVVDPSPRYVQVLKTSTDPTIDVGDAVFALLDHNGDEVARATSDLDGVAKFAGVSADGLPASFSVIEISAPVGLIAATGSFPIHDPSLDPDTPTVVSITNEPQRVRLRVQKQLSQIEATPPDMSGFGFEVVRRSDGWRADLTSGGDGATTAAQLALGDYEICELGTPDWAADLIDAGCQSVTIDLDTITAESDVWVTYLNIVPTTTTTTTTPATTTTSTTTTAAPPGLATTIPVVVLTASTTTTTTSTTSPASTTSSTAPPPASTLPTPSTLPPTGSDGVGRVLRFGDIGFVAGIGLVSLAGLAPRRRGRPPQ